MTNAPARLASMISEIRTTNPKIKIIVCTIPPILDPTNNALATAYNASLRQFVQTSANSGQAIFLADINAVLNFTDLGSDGIHPNDGGYVKIASVINSIFAQNL